MKFCSLRYYSKYFWFAMLFIAAFVLAGFTIGFASGMLARTTDIDSVTAVAGYGAAIGAGTGIVLISIDRVLTRYGTRYGFGENFVGLSGLLIGLCYCMIIVSFAMGAVLLLPFLMGVGVLPESHLQIISGLFFGWIFLTFPSYYFLKQMIDSKDETKMPAEATQGTETGSAPVAGEIEMLPILPTRPAAVQPGEVLGGPRQLGPAPDGCYNGDFGLPDLPPVIARNGSFTRIDKEQVGKAAQNRNGSFEQVGKAAQNRNGSFEHVGKAAQNRNGSFEQVGKAAQNRNGSFEHVEEKPRKTTFARNGSFRIDKERSHSELTRRYNDRCHPMKEKILVWTNKSRTARGLPEVDKYGKEPATRRRLLSLAAEIANA